MMWWTFTAASSAESLKEVSIIMTAIIDIVFVEIFVNITFCMNVYFLSASRCWPQLFNILSSLPDGPSRSAACKQKPYMVSLITPFTCVCRHGVNGWETMCYYLDNFMLRCLLFPHLETAHMNLRHKNIGRIKIETNTGTLSLVSWTKQFWNRSTGHVMDLTKRDDDMHIIFSIVTAKSRKQHTRSRSFMPSECGGPTVILLPREWSGSILILSSVPDDINSQCAGFVPVLVSLFFDKNGRRCVVSMQSKLSSLQVFGFFVICQADPSTSTELLASNLTMTAAFGIWCCFIFSWMKTSTFPTEMRFVCSGKVQHAHTHSVVHS